METHALHLSGRSLIGTHVGNAKGKAFHAVNPVNGEKLEPAFYTATAEEIDQAANFAADAFQRLLSVPVSDRIAFLECVAENLTAEGPAIMERAMLETGLVLPRLAGELKRTVGQFRLFAEVLKEGFWVNARIDHAKPDGKPPRPDLRGMLRPLGPVAVFGASNFPLAYSVAGGDTASAFAAGNPVVVKAHPAHPGTSELVANVLKKSAEQCKLPEGMFSLLFDAGVEVGVALVQHPAIKAVGFTGSASGGQALMRLASQRPEPIPCYAEMGSTNPLFILAGAMRERSAEIALGLQNSFTLGSGQFCTKPGMVFLPKDQSPAFEQSLKNGVSNLQHFGILTHGIAGKYKQAIEHRVAEGRARLLAGNPENAHGDAAAANATVFSVELDELLAHPELGEEVFGPTTLLVHYGNENDLLTAAHQLQGHLTATIHGTPEDLARSQELIHVLETKAGRLVFNGYPTGVDVGHAIVHGGPFPATSDTRTTSVGSQAILRFARPVCYQDFPDAALPPELRNANPMGILRIVDGKFARE